MNIVKKAFDAAKNIKNYWHTPPSGRYMPYKEIAALSGGGIGVRFVSHCINQLILSVGNTIIGNTIGINPTALYVIYIISVLSAFPLTALRAKMIDNTRSMKGKYRPYLIVMGIPTAILGATFMWMPYENMSLFAKCATVLFFNIGFQFFFNFYMDSYENLINVLSPNSIERSDVLSVRCIIENLSPSIVSILFPLFAKLVTGEDTLYELNIYRYSFTPLIIIGFIISVIVYVNTKEKIIQAKTHIIQVKFFDAFRAVARNKYFWIISLAGWIGFLETAFANILQWMYNYQGACSAGQYSIITAIAGNASLWPNIVAPFLIRKYGKKKILILTNILNVGFILAMLPVVRMTGTPHIIWLLLVCIFINQFLTSLGHLLSPSINADIRDYQHYISGERIDGMFAAVGLIGNVITMATGFILPTIYERSGLNSDVAVSLGYSADNVYDVLYNTEYFVSITSVLIIASVIGAALNVIPFFFYDFTETKQKAIVKILKIRAFFEDMSNGVLTDELKEEVKEIIRETNDFYAREPHDIKTETENFRKNKPNLSKEEKKDFRKKLNKMREENEKIQIAVLVKDELDKFNTPAGAKKYEYAQSIVSAGVNGFSDIPFMSKAEAKNMPRSTQEEKDLRTYTLRLLSDIKIARKTAKKHYPDGITEFDSSVFEKLFAAEDKTEKDITSLIEKIHQAKAEKLSTKELNTQLKALRATKEEIKREIKKATNYNSIYYRATKPYADAIKLLTQRENYCDIDKIELI